MTRGGLSIDQKMVDRFVESTIKNPSDFGKTIDLTDLGFEMTIDFDRMREFFSRGLCLDLQRRERGNTSITLGKLRDELRKRGINPDEIVNSLKG